MLSTVAEGRKVLPRKIATLEARASVRNCSIQPTPYPANSTTSPKATGPAASPMKNDRSIRAEEAPTALLERVEPFFSR